MSNFKTIPATGYYSCGTVTDSDGQTHAHLIWFGTKRIENFEMGNLWFFNKGEEVRPETTIIYPTGGSRKITQDK